MDVLTERTANILLEDYDDADERGTVPLKERRLTKTKSRRRRRSSARFLKLGDNAEDDGDDDNHSPMENLGDVYQKTIRMNAENRINASNSWNLSLIDHMDRFLMPQNQQAATLEDTLGPTTGVNFTKASCTLDASVKIYSYRVDDVHLTSYKVLANLNRTDSGKKARGGDDAAGGQPHDDNGSEHRQERRKAMGTTETLESNLGNININKLDSAFDIDPLFHKMCKSFDEGGAKGLLLSNLAVSPTGCNIVFDSTLDEVEETPTSSNSETIVQSAGEINVTSLTAQLETSLNGQAVHQLPLVPQLASLRSEFAQLKEDGFVQNAKPSKRYTPTVEEEMEADRSIHVEAIERSRVSQVELGRRSLAADDDSTLGDDGGGGFAPDDFGGADDDDFGDDNVGFPIGSFIHDGDHRFSSESFQTTFEARQPPSQATALLDAIAAGDISGSQSNYEYFNRKALESIQGNNMWAGASHWKKMHPQRKAKTINDGEDGSTPTAATKKRKGKTPANKSKRAPGEVVIDISKSDYDLEDLLRQPPKGKKGSNPLQMTKAAITKASKNDNLLPLDAGITVDSLTTLFLRPNTNVREFATASRQVSNVKNVGFGGVETWGDDNDSYGGDDGGLGYDFGGDNDNNDETEFVVPELEGVRKVEKVQVGYATVAKKVDVKRLKRDLWVELERTFQERGQIDSLEEQAESTGDTDDTLQEEDMEDVEEPLATPKHSTDTMEDPLSFHDTVQDMQSSQTQSDVTLPFYFICVLHLANEKGLALESKGLEDFLIHSS